MRSRMKYVRVDDSIYATLMRLRNTLRVRSVHAVVRLLVAKAIAPVSCPEAEGEMVVQWLCVNEDVYKALAQFKEQIGATSMRAAVRTLLETGA